jgi:hypothetical protein
VEWYKLLFTYSKNDFNAKCNFSSQVRGTLKIERKFTMLLLFLTQKWVTNCHDFDAKWHFSALTDILTNFNNENECKLTTVFFFSQK